MEFGIPIHTFLCHLAGVQEVRNLYFALTHVRVKSRTWDMTRKLPTAETKVVNMPWSIGYWTMFSPLKMWVVLCPGSEVIKLFYAQKHV